MNTIVVNSFVWRAYWDTIHDRWILVEPVMNADGTQKRVEEPKSTKEVNK